MYDPVARSVSHVVSQNMLTLLNRALELENISHTTILRTSRDIGDPTLSNHTINNLNKCYVYLLACLSGIMPMPLFPLTYCP